MWWEVFKEKSDYTKRRQEKLLHAFSGNFTHWENIFCDYFGVDWRLTRDICKSLTEWMQHFPGFARSTCKSCGLFFPVNDPASEVEKPTEPPQKHQKTKQHKLEDLPASHADVFLGQAVLLWDNPFGRL